MDGFGQLTFAERDQRIIPSIPFDDINALKQRLDQAYYMNRDKYDKLEILRSQLKQQGIPGLTEDYIDQYIDQTKEAFAPIKETNAWERAENVVREQTKRFMTDEGLNKVRSTYSEVQEYKKQAQEEAKDGKYPKNWINTAYAKSLDQSIPLSRDENGNVVGGNFNPYYINEQIDEYDVLNKAIKTYQKEGKSTATLEAAVKNPAMMQALSSGSFGMYAIKHKGGYEGVNPQDVYNDAYTVLSNNEKYVLGKKSRWEIENYGKDINEDVTINRIMNNNTFMSLGKKDLDNIPSAVNKDKSLKDVDVADLTQEEKLLVANSFYDKLYNKVALENKDMLEEDIREVLDFDLYLKGDIDKAAKTFSNIKGGYVINSDFNLIWDQAALISHRISQQAAQDDLTTIQSTFFDLPQSGASFTTTEEVDQKISDINTLQESREKNINSILDDWTYKGQHVTPIYQENGIKLEIPIKDEETGKINKIYINPEDRNSTDPLKVEKYNNMLGQYVDPNAARHIRDYHRDLDNQRTMMALKVNAEIDAGIRDRETREYTDLGKKAIGDIEKNIENFVNGFGIISSEEAKKRGENLYIQDKDGKYYPYEGTVYVERVYENTDIGAEYLTEEEFKEKVNVHRDYLRNKNRILKEVDDLIKERTEGTNVHAMFLTTGSKKANDGFKRLGILAASNTNIRAYDRNDNQISKSIMPMKDGKPLTDNLMFMGTVVHKKEVVAGFNILREDDPDKNFFYVPVDQGFLQDEHWKAFDEMTIQDLTNIYSSISYSDELARQMIEYQLGNGLAEFREVSVQGQQDKFSNIIRIGLPGRPAYVKFEKDAYVLFMPDNPDNGTGRFNKTFTHPDGSPMYGVEFEPVSNWNSIPVKYITSLNRP